MANTTGVITGDTLSGDLGGTVLNPILQNTANVQSIIAASGTTTPDATSTIKGKLQLTGDLGGTASLPTVPGLVNKADISSLSTVATTGSYNDLLNKPAPVTVNDASTTAKGIVQLAGDLAGTATAPTVPGLANKANTASPAFTGTPTAPTAAASTNTTQIATTAFTQAAITALINASPSTLDTLKELADAIGDDPNFAVTVSNQIATKSNIASPTFTGTPAAPTATAGTNTTQIATTAFVAGAVASVSSADATTTSKGIVQLAGDLAGTANAPTVPALATKKNIITNQGTKTANFTAVPGGIHLVDASAGNVTVTFPTSTIGQEFQLKKIDASVPTGSTTGIVIMSGKINGVTAASVPLRKINQGKQAVADGTGGWLIALGDIDITSLYATTVEPGTVQLAGDLGGTPQAPTTPTAVHLTGNETITGTKTFNDRPTSKHFNVIPASSGGSASLFLDNLNGARWEFFANNGGQFGVYGAGEPFAIDWTATTYHQWQLASSENQSRLPVNMFSNKITSVADPTLAQDAATKNYVDTNQRARLVTQVTASITAATATKSDFWYYWTGSTAYSVTLPTATSSTNKYTFKNLSTVNQTIIAASGQTIDLSPSATVIPNQSISIISYGNSWMVD